MENLYVFATASRIRLYHVKCDVVADHGIMAPSASVKSLLGSTSVGSISNFVPSPWQVGQAPCGELNEKNRGEISGIEILQSAHAKRSENTSSFLVSLS